MIEYQEVQPIPNICKNCNEGECYNCDYTLKRWKLTPKSENELQEIIQKAKKARQIKQKQRRERDNLKIEQYQA